MKSFLNYFRKNKNNKEEEIIYSNEPSFIIAYFLKKYSLKSIRLNAVVDLFLLIEVSNLIQKKECHFKNYVINAMTVINKDIEKYFVYKKYLTLNAINSNIRYGNEYFKLKQALSFYGDTYYLLELTDTKLEEKKVDKNVEFILKHYFENYVKSIEYNNILSSINFLPFVSELTSYHKKEINLEKEVIRYLTEKFKYTGRENIKF
tara:strand:- start:8614 stop:9228 length:615 start_codon:yes stop_codon:yes gene_type:complete